MRLSAIAALSRNRVIGFQGRLPWRLKGDLAYFREKTMGKVVVMGRTTYESIGRPLPGRRLAILSRAPRPSTPEVRWFTSLESILEVAATEEEVMVAGGAEVYRLFLPLLTGQYLTEIDGEYEGDAFYPPFNPAQWREVERIPGPADSVPYSFVTYLRT